jgi:D-apionolactonase
MSATTLSFEPVSLGALALKLDRNGAFAREISLDGEELFRGVGFVVRDANWGTPALSAEAVISRQDGRIVAESGGTLDSAGGDLTWSAAWTIADNWIEATARASSRSGFETNRTGFVALHSLPAARGRPVKVTHPDGSVEETLFPDLVSPHQPFFDIAALEYTTSAGHRLRLSFKGEVFEIEDQRNWTDASYKTYCRPLRLPFPYRVIGQSAIVEQTVRLEILAPAPAASNKDGARPAIVRTATMPVLGASLPPGPLRQGQAEALRALALGFTAIEIDLSDAGWFAEAGAKIAAAPGPVRIDVRRSEPSDTRACVSALAPLLAGKTMIGLSLWDADDATIASARTAAPRMRIGGGTGAFFTELNRMTRWPGADYLTWTSNPTVHGFNDDTIGETTEPLADIVRTARARSPSARFQIGPMTLGLRYNPNATTAEGRRRTAAPDPRQSGMIAAAWLVGTIAGFLDPAVETLTFFEPVGPKGLLSADGAWSPAAHVLARLSSYAGCPVSVLHWPSQQRAVGVLIEAADRQILCFAHPRDEDHELSLPQGAWQSAERLTPAGFVESSPAKFRAERFGLSWLARRR